MVLLYVIASSFCRHSEQINWMRPSGEIDIAVDVLLYYNKLYVFLALLRVSCGCLRKLRHQTPGKEGCCLYVCDEVNC